MQNDIHAFQEYRKIGKKNKEQKIMEINAKI